MTGFEWTVVVLLILILLKPRSMPPKKHGDEQFLLSQCEEHIRMIRHDGIEEIRASLSSIEADLRVISKSHLNDQPNDQP